MKIQLKFQVVSNTDECKCQSELTLEITQSAKNLWDKPFIYVKDSGIEIPCSGCVILEGKKDVFDNFDLTFDGEMLYLSPLVEGKLVFGSPTVIEQ